MCLTLVLADFTLLATFSKLVLKVGPLQSASFPVFHDVLRLELVARILEADDNR